MNRLRRVGTTVAVVAVVMLRPGVALAQGTTAPIPQSPEFAAVRARFEQLTPEQIAALGYRTEPACVATPAGGMGFHSMNRRLWELQFNTGRLDPENPPLLLLDAGGRVVGLEWEADQTVPPPVLFGQTAPLLPGHPGLEEPHYMLHAYFRPDGEVLFDVFDPQLRCPAASGAAPATQTGAAPTAQSWPAPTQLPRSLPRTGLVDDGADWITSLAATGVAMLLGGLVLPRRRARREDAGGRHVDRPRTL